ncbi:uncharacterized protein LOC119767765 [Culex quinquefasciatus]|uniref:uncharacterized protein LOC119767765 n=1 Tax=Culex quinquefasciatus TaxID=7176 RepID=UPI0018E3933E|nr:uncharacterized protein LOC119767765 [Culex quinquefasciatus]
MPGMFGMPRNRCSLRSPPECQHLLGGGSRRGDWVDAGKGAETAIYGVPLDLQLDSGSGITIISRQNWVNVGSPKRLHRTATSRQLPGTNWASRRCSEQPTPSAERTRRAIAMFVWDVPFSSFCKLVGTQTPNQQVVELKAKFFEMHKENLYRALERLKSGFRVMLEKCR